MGVDCAFPRGALDGGIDFRPDVVERRGFEPCGGKTRRYFRCVGNSILRRSALLLTALAFLLATAQPISVPATAMPTETMQGMAMPADAPCRNCPDKAPKSDLGKMACGPLACAGAAIGLAAMTTSYAPGFAHLAYAPTPTPVTIGAAPAPDPLPPRPIVLG
jgi:hypothetical protein